jgi:Flp pilus assembly pilin Flp
MLKNLWSDDSGIVALEYLLVATIVGLGLVVGLQAVGKSLNSELVELADAINALDQSYSFQGWSTCGASKAGSAAADTYSGFTISCVAPVAVSINQLVCCSP